MVAKQAKFAKYCTSLSQQIILGNLYWKAGVGKATKPNLS